MATLIARNSAKLAGAQRTSSRRSVASRAVTGRNGNGADMSAAGLYTNAATPFDNYNFAPIREATVCTHHRSVYSLDLCLLPCGQPLAACCLSFNRSALQEAASFFVSIQM